ncbi:MAG: AarF/ABC1/UbiB kinase family protein [Proteobacteria bacterium]|nr:MAG: AarF/ABC1/UbiB kinase family protein [Pseudomonadota bacterium]
MKWIKTGQKLNLAVRNAGRLKEILGVFAKHGFVDVLTRMDLERFIPARWRNWIDEAAELSTEQRLRLAFEELGPTFTKLGQLLATRPDLVPESFVEEFAHLQDDVRTLPFETIRTVVETELGKPLSEAFATFEEVPIAAASIAQVHAASLHTGERVVVKIQRPGIDRIIDHDIHLMEFLAKMLEKYIPESRVFAPSVIVDEFFRSLKQELDFFIEANNLQRIRANLAVYPEIVIPAVHRNLSTKRVLTMERLFGTPMRDIEKVKSEVKDLKRLTVIAARAFFKTVMVDGIFHGDLHGGNIFILPDGRFGLIDFGIVGRLSPRSRQQLSNMMLAIVTEDYEALCIQYAELGAAGPSVDFDAFQREVRNTLAPYMGLRLNEVNAGQLLIEATKVATKYQIRIPGDWMMVFRALFTMEGMGRALDPDFDMLELGRELMQDLVKDQFSMERYSKEFIWIGKDLLGLAQVLPRQLKWFLRKWNQDGFAFEIKSPELAELTIQLEKNQRRQSSSIVAAGLFIASAITLHFDDVNKIFHYPLFAVLTFVAAIILWLRS